MARPRKEGMDYFPHDTDAANDEKIEALRSLYGNDGYAFYFIMLERIYRTADFEIDVSDAETREQTFHILARKIAVTREQFEKMLCTALKWGCFDKVKYEENGIITSEGIKKRASVVVEKREKMRLKRQSDNTLVSDAETREQTGVQIPQSKEKKSKEKKSNNNYLDDSPYMKMIDYFIEKIQTWMPDFKFKGSKQTWADDFRKLVEIDKATRQDIAAVMDYLPNDTFWRKNVLSAKKFREQFMRLKAEMVSKGERAHARTGRAVDSNSSKGGASPFDGFKVPTRTIERESNEADEFVY